MESGQFIARYYGGGRSTGLNCIASYSNVRGDPDHPPCAIYVRDAGAIDDFVANRDVPGAAVYHGVNPIHPSRRRRIRANVYEYSAAFTDCDFKSIVEDPATVLETLLNLACPPTVIVHSGHGYHPYWFFTLAIPAEPAMEARYVAVLKGLCRILAGDPAVCEVARVMRLPGTHNSKGEGEWLSVQVVDASDRFYTLDELEQFIASASVLLHHPVPEEKPDNSIAGRFRAHARRARRLSLDVQELLDSMCFGGGENGIHKTQLRVSASLLNQGKDPHKIVDLLLARTKFVHDRDCPREQWDWDRERNEIDKIIARWQQRLEQEQQHQQQQAPPRSPPQSEPPLRMNGATIRFRNFWRTEMAPELPRGILPAVIEDYAFSVAQQMGTDPAGLAFSALVCAAAVIPDWIRLQVKSTNKYWLESARLWVALVGDVSARKSAMITHSMRPIRKIERNLYAQYKRLHDDWKQLDKKERDAQPEPLRKHIKMEDTSMESAQEIFRASEDGALVYRDELGGWFGNMEKYGHRSGRSDRSFWLQTFDGGEYAFHRIGRGDHLVTNIGASVFGGIQPLEIAAIVRAGGDNGLIQRILPIQLRAAGYDVDVKIDAAVEAYELLINRLYHKIWDRAASILHYEPEAQDMQLKIDDLVVDVQRNRFWSDHFRGHIGKYPNIFARHCLLFHCIENSDRDMPLHISDDIAMRVATLLDYLFDQALLFYQSVNDEVSNIDVVRQLASWILRNPNLTSVNSRTLMRHCGTANRLDRKGLDAVLEHLTFHGWLTPDEAPKAKVNSLTKFWINVDVHKDPELSTERRSLEWDIEESKRIMQMRFAGLRTVN